MNFRNKIIASCFSLTALSSQAGMLDQFFDPQDGQLDASQWVFDNSHGFLPIPIIITEPAVGVGAGAALLFFHETDEQKENRLNNPEQAKDVPLSVTGVVGAATSNGTALGGVFHSGNWMDDRVRYLGALFGMSVNLDLYTPILNDSLKINMEGLYFTQDIDVRISDSNFFVGGSYSLLDSETKLDTSKYSPTFNEIAHKSKDGDIGIKLTYDNRNNHVTPNSGTKAGIEYNVHSKKLGGDFEYQATHAYINNYNKISEKWGLALRADAKSVDSDEFLPWYAKPYLDMRGMPAMFYRGDDTVLAEAEISYDINQRWTVLGFAGTGKAIQKGEDFNDAKTRNMQGAGFRYLIARQLGMKTGIDIAKGPEEWTLYLQFGTAW